MASSDSDEYDYSEEEEEDDDDDDDEEEDDEDDEDEYDDDDDDDDDDEDEDDEQDEDSYSEYSEEEMSYGEYDDEDEEEEEEDKEDAVALALVQNAAEEAVVEDEIANNENSDVDDSRALPPIDSMQREPDEISEITDGPFSGQSTPDISLDPAIADYDNGSKGVSSPNPVPVRKDLVIAAPSPDISANMETMSIKEESRGSDSD